MGSNYRSLLVRISNQITQANLEKWKFLCSDDIEEGELEEINSTLKLFKALERRELLAIDELSLLRELLENIECIQLVREVDDFISRRQLELLGLKRKQGTPCRKNHPNVEPDCRETELAAACEYSMKDRSSTKYQVSNIGIYFQYHMLQALITLTSSH